MSRDEVHALILSFPETSEGTSYGRAGYKAFGKFLTHFEDESVVLATPFDEREMLCEADPTIFHVTNHVRKYPFVLARIAAIEPDQLRSFLTRQWRKAAPKRWLKAYDAEHAP